jgi:putative intracellular protease/amidase
LLDDIIDADYAFLNDPDARAKLAQTLPLAQVNPQHYAAVYFVGGKGTMFDFPGNADIQRIVRDIAPRGVIGAVCHGPAALLNLRLDSGVNLLKQRAVTGFTNAEELFLIADARTRHGFLLEDALKAEAEFREGPMFLDHTVVDGNLITGQNPWSTWSTAEQMIRALGHEPVARAISNEEHSVNLLGTYRRDGIDAAIAHKATLERSDKRLIVMHALIAAMQWQLLDSHRLLRLARAPHR